ncbi:MAG: chemotaxis protein CheW [Candidatus Gastranaerophilaceae bacterium]|jgi:purine-binding chemotaxis protein CheW
METKFLVPGENIIEKKELFMTFCLSGKNYAVKASDIIEITQIPSMIFPEKLPRNVVGLVNLRGKIIKIVDIRGFLGFENSKYTVDHQILIVNIKNETIGIIADTVNDVILFNPENIEKLPYENAKSHLDGVFDSKDKLIAFLNLGSIFEETNKLQLALENVEEVQKNLTDGLLPTDEISVQKLKKRALNLQKEIKFELDKNYYIKDKFVSFSLNNEIYSLSLKYVKEFTKLKNIKITPIPCVPDFINGLINLRGEFITIIDIKYFLNIAKTNITEKTKIIVLKTDRMQIGLLVDEVFDIVSIPVEKLKTDSTNSFEKDTFTIGEVILKDKKIMNILNIERLLSDERLYFEDAV